LTSGLQLPDIPVSKDLAAMSGFSVLANDESQEKEDPLVRAQRGVANVFKKPSEGKKTDPDLDPLLPEYLFSTAVFGIPLKSLVLKSEKNLNKVLQVPLVVSHCVNFFKAFHLFERQSPSPDTNPDSNLDLNLDPITVRHMDSKALACL